MIRKLLPSAHDDMSWDVTYGKSCLNLLGKLISKTKSMHSPSLYIEKTLERSSMDLKVISESYQVERLMGSVGRGTVTLLKLDTKKLL